jgi:tRNA pseudouridine38-40 synthase
LGRYFIEIAYNGSYYHGWQIQNNAVTVQGELNKAFKQICGKDIDTLGCGRTDTAVHANQFFVHFNVDELPTNFVYRLNGVLPKSIVVKRIIDVDDDAHARFGATARTYQYFVHQNKDPFIHPLSCFIPQELNIDLMNEAANKLFNYIDFTSFSKVHSDAYTNNCDIMHAQWTEIEEGRYVFEIKANRFLRNMVRAIVGTLIKVGKGKITVDEFCEIIESKDRGNAGKSVTGKALFLYKIDYPFID